MIGDSEGQQIWDALSISVALRLWKKMISDRRARLCIRGDNVGAFMLICRMRPATAKQAIVAREIAFEFAESAFIPDVTHTPGISNIIVDALSRTNAPGYESTFAHESLSNTSPRTTQERGEHWYRALEHY